MKKWPIAVYFTAIVSAFAQWGGGGFGGGGFGGPQSGNSKMEYSEKFADVNYVGDLIRLLSIHTVALGARTIPRALRI